MNTETTTATAILKNDRKFLDLLEDVKHAFALTVQNAIGQTDGGIAGVHFSDDDNSARLALALRQYLKDEAAYEDEGGE
jgi:hypothetical protein